MKFRIEKLERRDLLTSTLVADINQLASHSSNPREFTHAAGTTFFVAESELGAELWRTDGTTEGTVIVRDIVEGADGSNPYELLPFRDILLFHVDGQVWRSDGTEAGTFPLDGMTRIIAANSTRAISENGLITDGTIDGTFVLENVRVSPIADEGVVTEEAFYLRFRGTRYFEINLAGESEQLENSRAELFSLDGKVFTASSLDGQTQIAAVDGEPEGGFAIEGALVGPDSFFDAGGIGYIETFDADDNALLWRTDGTSDGTFMVATFAQDPDVAFGDSAPTVANSMVAGDDAGEVWFIASDRFGEEVWRSDGTVAGTGVVRDVFRGRLGSQPSDLFVQGEALWFVANDGVNGRQVWQTDGTSDGTVRVTRGSRQLSDYSEGPTILGVGSDRVYFRSLSDDGVELWVTDGSTASTRQLKDIMPGENGSFPASLIVQDDGSALFTATTHDGNELWKTDGTEAGTVLVKDIHDRDETRSSNPNGLVEFNGKLYFVANDGIHGSELWSYDGNVTSMVADIWSGPKSSSPKQLTVVGDSLFFAAEDETHGRELFRLGRFGVTLVDDLAVGEAGSNPDELIELNDRLYFVADIDESTGPQSLGFATRRGLWSTNGTSVRLEVETVSPTARVAAGSVFNLTKFDGKLYFYELNAAERNDVRVHRLTPNNDQSVTDEIVSETSVRLLGGFYGMQANDEFLIFAGEVLDNARDVGVLVVTPGNDPVATVWSDRFPSTDTLTAVGNEFYLSGRVSYLFNAEADGAVTAIRDDDVITESLIVGGTTYLAQEFGNGGLLLSGDVRTNDTESVARFRSTFPLQNAVPSDFTEWNDTLYFIVNDAESAAGIQIWRVNDDQDGVEMVTSFGADRLGSQASSLFVFNDELYFTADDGVTGRELWKIPKTVAVGDVNDDGEFDSMDIDALFAAIQDGESGLGLDLNGDALVDAADVVVLVEDVLQTRFGDTDLNGDVDFSDFLKLADSFGEQDVGWADGDLNGDGEVTFEDYLVLVENYI